MQIKEQWKASRNWKLVTGVATAATLGIGAIAVAAPGSNEVPQTIDLNDRAVVSETTVPTTFGSFVPFDVSASFDSVSGDSLTDDSVTGDSLSRDSLTDDSISTDSVSTDSVSTDSVSTETFDSVSADSVSVDSLDSVSLDSVSDDSNDSA